MSDTQVAWFRSGRRSRARICSRAGILTLASHTVFVCGLVALCFAAPAAAQTAANVLVVINEASPDSREIADYYVRQRAIPVEQVVRLHLPIADELERSVYEAQIEQPIGGWIREHAAHDRILYIVLTKGVPLRISGSSGQSGTVASVDSELTLLYQKLAGASVAFAGPVKNPYFLGDASPGNARPFTHERQDIYLVTRLDGFSVADVKAVIDRGMAASQDGHIVLDGRIEAGAQTPGNTWLERAASTLRQLSGWSDRVVLDTTSQPVGSGIRSLGYYSWGSNDMTVQLVGAPKLEFVPGALAGMFVSTDARTFRAPPDDWKPGGGEFGGSNQSLTGALIRAGITGVAGHVAEPYLIAAIRPDVLFPAYIAGLNLAEAFYSAMPFVSWQTVVIGDPLCAPFRHKTLEQPAIDPGIDATSELPVFMTAHRLRSLASSGFSAEALKLMMRAEVRSARQDRAGARDALERATVADEGLLAGHLALAALHESTSEWDAAIARYRRILARAPNHVVALNNVAYILADRKHAPAEALPLAQRAYALSNEQPVVADTLAWIHYLLGEHGKAAPLIVAAAERVPLNADIQLHAAFVLAATGVTRAATEALDKALSLNAALAEREDVRQLRSRLERP